MNVHGMLPVSCKIADIPGGGMMPVSPARHVEFVQDMDVNATFNVTIADDKKTAVVNSVNTQALCYPDGRKIDGDNPRFCIVKRIFNFTLNLSSHENEQGVTGSTLGQ